MTTVDLIPLLSFANRANFMASIKEKCDVSAKSDWCNYESVHVYFVAVIAAIYNLFCSQTKTFEENETNIHSFENEIYCDKSEALLGVISHDHPQKEFARNGSKQKNGIERIAHVAIEQGSNGIS